MDKKKGKVPWWIIALLVLLALYFFNTEDLEVNLIEYSSCVSDCKFDISMCMDYPSSFSNTCMVESNVAECVDDLEICLDSCEADWAS